MHYQSVCSILKYLFQILEQKNQSQILRFVAIVFAAMCLKNSNLSISKDIDRFSIFFFVKITSYRPTYPVELVAKILAFESHEKCVEWMTPYQVAITDNTSIDCKTSASVAIPLIV